MSPPAERHQGPSRGARAKRSFGQCFLVEPGVAHRIAELATTPSGGQVVEIGVGRGALTRPLLGRASRVVGLERDRDLLPDLRRDFADVIEAGRLELMEVDAKSVDPASLLRAAPGPRVLAGNIPYNITGPLLRRAVESSQTLDAVVFMVQREVAERLRAAVGTSAYGALTVFVRARFEVHHRLHVPPGCFRPRPSVASSVIELRPHSDPTDIDAPYFTELVRSAFQQRRKTLRNAWRSLPEMTDARLSHAAAQAQIDLGWRGERLGTRDFARMARELARSGA